MTEKLCEDCDEPIAPKRLAALPFTRHCVRCAPPVTRRTEAHFAGTNALIQHTENSNWRKPTE